MRIYVRNIKRKLQWFEKADITDVKEYVYGRNIQMEFEGSKAIHIPAVEDCTTAAVSKGKWQ